MQFVEPGGRHKLVIGMVHLGPLPGTPYHEAGSLEGTVERAVRSARALLDGGADGCLVQTVDRVYSPLDVDDPARTAAMALVVAAIRRETGAGFRIGVQLMWNAIRASLAVAKVAGGTFVRANALVGSTLTPHGTVEAEPLAVMQYRRQIEARDVPIVADIQTMHFSWSGGGKPLGEVARAAQRVGADAVCVCDPDDDRTLQLIEAVRAASPDMPVIVGGHTSHANAGRLLAAADGAFVGTCLEKDGWGGEIDVERVRAYVDAAGSAAS